MLHLVTNKVVFKILQLINIFTSFGASFNRVTTLSFHIIKQFTRNFVNIIFYLENNMIFSETINWDKKYSSMMLQYL